MKSPLRIPQLLKSYRQTLKVFEEHNWTVFNHKYDDPEEDLGLFLWVNLPDYVVNLECTGKGGYPDHSLYWDKHRIEIIEDLRYLERLKKLKKIHKKIERKNS